MFVSSNALMRGVLSEAEGEGSGGGGEAAKALTEEDVGRIVNSAVTAHLKRELPKAIGGALTPALEAALKPIQEHLAKVPQGEQPEAGKQSPELAALKRQLEEQTKIIEVERSARLDAEKRQRLDHAKSAVLGHIDASVKPELKEFLSDYLFNRVEFDESGSPLIRVGGSDDALPLKDGIASFLKTKEASAFLPAPTAKPGVAKAPGARQISGLPTYDKPAASDEERARRAYEREQAIEAATR